MSDERLISEVAELWVANGGDAEGILWCVDRIRAAIETKMAENTASLEGN